MRAYFNPTSAISVQSCYTLASHKEIKRSRGHPGAPGFGATSPIIAIPSARIARYRSACWLFIFPFLPSFFIIFSEKKRERISQENAMDFAFVARFTQGFPFLVIDNSWCDRVIAPREKVVETAV